MRVTCALGSPLELSLKTGPPTSHGSRVVQKSGPSKGSWVLLGGSKKPSAIWVTVDFLSTFLTELP